MMKSITVAIGDQKYVNHNINTETIGRPLSTSAKVGRDNRF